MDPERIVAMLDLKQSTYGPIHRQLMDERIRASATYGDNDPNPFYGMKGPISLNRWKDQLEIMSIGITPGNVSESDKRRVSEHFSSQKIHATSIKFNDLFQDPHGPN